MARDVTGRLGRLNARRKGIDRMGRLTEEAQLDILQKSVTEESWQKRASTAKPYTRYALGAMQEVGPDYTRISIETATRVGKQLNDGLIAAGYSVDFRLQGSVPLNVHIRGTSDVDLLNLDTSFYTYATNGQLSLMGHYQNPTSRTSIGVLSDLRRDAERILTAKFPKATVNCTGGKAINISGASLARPVDVVPAHWYDTMGYQRSRAEHDRAVTILDKKVPVTLDNLPFLHIKLIHERDQAALAGLKKAIRLCKSVKSDAESEGIEIALSSFDIAAAMYHADMGALTMGYAYELAILAETQRHLDWLTQNEEQAKLLMVPDGSRAIFNTPAKLAALRKLSIEMDDLMTEVANEQQPAITKRGWSDSRNILAKSHIPAA